LFDELADENQRAARHETGPVLVAAQADFSFLISYSIMLENYIDHSHR
jgi:hypothetical protein